MDGELIAAIIFYGIIGLIIYKNRKKFSWIQGIVLAYRTKKPLAWMDKLNPGNLFWKIYGTICIPLCFYYMPQLVYLLGTKAIDILTMPGEQAGVALAIPGVHIPGSPIYIPLFYGIISIGILALVHEMAHGIIGKSERVKMKSSGFGMFLIFPLFFVEPDEKSLSQSSKLSRLRMISAGTGTNIMLAMLIFLITSLTIMPFLESVSVSEGIKITSLLENYPASNANITTGTIILGINNVSFTNITEFNNELIKHAPNETILLNTSNGIYEVKLASNPSNSSRPYMGVFTEEAVSFSTRAKALYTEGALNLIRIIYELLIWIGFLNFSIGIMNLLPIWGLDGSALLYNLLSYVMPEAKAKLVTSITSSTCLGFLIINLLPAITGLFA